MAYNIKPRVPKTGFKQWLTQDCTMTPQEVVDKYNSGFAGVIYSEAEREATLESMAEPDGEKIAYQNGFVGAGAGQLTMLWQYSQKHWQVWPKPPQETGDCVGHAGANIGILLIGVDAASGVSDEVTNKVEGFPELTAVAVKNGVVAFEPIYGDRGHAGQGANCDRLIRHMTEWGGVILREDYVGVANLEKVDTNLAIKWGRTQTPEAVRALGRPHQVRHATAVNGWEMARDFVSRGCPIWVCAGLSWSSKRDEFGFSVQTREGWGHSWVVDGFDDRPETIKRYGFSLFHYNHDWGKWNSGGVAVNGTNETIPEGSFWGKATLLDQVDMTAMNSVSGWPQKNLPPTYVPGIFT